MSAQAQQDGNSGYNSSPTHFAQAGVTQGAPPAGYLGPPSQNTSSSSMTNGPGVSQQMPPHLGKRKANSIVM